MASLRLISTRISGLFSKRRINREIEEELAFHLRMRAEENLRRGQSSEEAQRNAARTFGNLEVIKEAARDMRGGGLLESCLNDLRFGWRILMKRKVATALVTIILALGIGGSTAIVGNIVATLFWKLPYAHADRLVRLSGRTNDASGLPNSTATLQSWSAYNDIFTEVAAYQFETLVVDIRSKPLHVRGEAVSANFFTVLGLPVALGRNFQPADDLAAAPAVCILEKAFWLRQLHGDLEVIGATLKINGKLTKVIGVISLNQPLTDEIFVPINSHHNSSRERLSTQGPYGVARLKPGITAAAAGKQLNQLALQGAAGNHPYDEIAAHPLRDDFSSGLSLSNFLLLIAAGLLLVIACANVSDLVLLYGARRANEFVMRMALGAGRLRIIRQLVSENAILLVLGTIGGAIVAFIIVVVLRHFFLPHASSVTTLGRTMSLDGPVFILTCLFAFSMITFFSIVAGTPITSQSLAQGLRLSGGTITLERQNEKVRSTLVVFQIAISLVLLFGAVCSFHSFRALDMRDPGFDPAGIVEIELPFAFAGRDNARELLDQLTLKLETIPGIESVAYSSNGLTDVMTCRYSINETSLATGRTGFAAFSITSSDYLNTIKARLLSGHLFDDNTSQSTMAPCVINENLARKEFPTGSPIGNTITVSLAGEEFQARIVGVVQYINQYGVENPELPPSQIYLSLSQVPPHFAQAALAQMKLFLRTNKDRTELEPAIAQTIQAMDSNQPSPRLLPLQQLLSGTRGQRSLKLAVFASFSVVAVLLAVVSLYSLVSHTISQRMREIGIRIALGAPMREIYALVSTPAARLLVLGLIAGIGLTMALNHFLEWQQGTATTMRSTLVIAFLFAFTAICSSCLSIRRTSSIDPNEVLRSQ